MNQNNHSSPLFTSVEITDEEHTLILMMRTMRLNEITHVMSLNNFLPNELPNKFYHITNIINLHFQKSYEVHVIKTLIEFISTHREYNQIFQQHSLEEMIENYQKKKVAESAGAYQLYLKPYTTECIQCKKQLKMIFSHRSKAVMSLARTYQARM